MPLSYLNEDQQEAERKEWEQHLLQVWKIMLDHVSFDESGATEKARAYVESLEYRPGVPIYGEKDSDTLIHSAAEGMKRTLDEVRRGPDRQFE